LNYKTSNKPNKKTIILQYLLAKLKNQSDFELEIEDQTLKNFTLSNIEHVLEDFLYVLTKITSKKIYQKNYINFFK
jgi:hypothetical protein